MNIFDAIKDNKTYNPKNSIQWFTSNVRSFAKRSNVTPMKVLGENVNKQSRTIFPGQMIMFYYDAKTKDKLEYWDKFPLVLPFSTSKTHFTGLNLHYLPPEVRMELLAKLSTTVRGTSESARMRIDWGILNSIAKVPVVNVAVKQYIFGYVKTNFLIVPQSEWPIAIHLPLEQFVGASLNSVWERSARRITKQK